MAYGAEIFEIWGLQRRVQIRLEGNFHMAHHDGHNRDPSEISGRPGSILDIFGKKWK